MNPFCHAATERYEIGRSRMAIYCYGIITLLALTAQLLSGLPLLPKLLWVLAAVIQGGWLLLQSMRSNKQRPNLMYSPLFGWRISSAVLAETPVQILPASRILFWIIILRLQTATGQSVWLIFRDSVSPTQFRRLSVRLRLAWRQLPSKHVEQLDN